jgi:hypothetical protein
LIHRIVTKAATKWMIPKRRSQGASQFVVPRGNGAKLLELAYQPLHAVAPPRKVRAGRYLVATIATRRNDRFDALPFKVGAKLVLLCRLFARAWE